MLCSYDKLWKLLRCRTLNASHLQELLLLQFLCNHHCFHFSDHLLQYKCYHFHLLKILLFHNNPMKSTVVKSNESPIIVCHILIRFWGLCFRLSGQVLKLKNQVYFINQTILVYIILMMQFYRRSRIIGKTAKSQKQY